MRGLAKDPKQRFPSIREFALALERASQAAPPLVIQSPYSTPSASLVSISSSIHSAITEEDTLVVPPASPPQQSQPVLGGATVPALDEWASQGMEPPAPVVSSTWAADTNAATIAGLASDAPAPAIGRVEHPAHLILRADNGEVLQEYVLEKLETSIGRAPNSDILLSRDRLASRRHATIRYENGNYILHDERSANGTFINGQLLEDDTPRILYDNDHIGIGEHEMTFRASRSPSSGVDIEGMPTIVVSSAASGMAYRTREGGLLNAAASDKCPFCGTETRSGDNFCLNCGNRLLPATPSSQQAQPVVGDATLPAVEEWALPVQKDWGGSLIGDVSMLTSPSVAFSGSNPPVLPLEERLVAESVFASPASPLVDEPVISSPPSSPVLAEPPPASSKHQTREQQLRKQRLEEGNAHYQAKRYEEALSMYEQLIALDPQDGLAHHSRGNALRKLKHFKEALGAYEQALAIISNDASIWIVKGQVLNSLRRYKEALTAYEQALALVPSNAVILTEKGEVLYKLERYTEALSACESSLALDSAIARTWTIKGNVLYRLERYEEALEAYDSALKMIHNIPKRASTFAAKGETFYKMERYDEALNAYDTACILKPQDATLANKRDMLRKLKRHKDQKEELEKSQLAVWSNMDIARLKQNEQPPSPVNSSPLISPKTADLQRTIIETRNPLERTLLFEHFDVFLSHLELDAQWVEQHLAMRLEDKERLRVWLDKWILIPGQPFQPARARGLDQARSCAVCIGEHNPNGWFEQEIQRAQNRQAKDPSFRVIPVLLPNAKDINLDNFLELKTVVDFRGSDPAYAFHLLVCGVKGIPPGRWSPEGSTITKPLTNAEDRLRELMQFRQSGLIDDTVALEYQRVVLEKIWLLSSSEPE